MTGKEDKAMYFIYQRDSQPQESSLTLQYSPWLPQSTQGLCSSSVQALHNQHFLPSCTPPHYFSLLCILTIQLLPSGTLPPLPVAQIRHSTAKTRRIPGIYKAPGTRCKPHCCRDGGTPFDSRNVELPHCKDIQVNSWTQLFFFYQFRELYTSQKPFRQGYCTSNLQRSFTEDTASVVLCTHADKFLLQMPGFTADQSSNTLRDVSTTSTSNSDFLWPKAGWEVFTLNNQLPAQQVLG